MTAGGRIPGCFLQLLVGAALEIWLDYRAPALLVGLSHLGAVAILCVVLASAIGARSTVFFLAVYWLSPWRLYHSGFLWEPGFVFLPAAVHLACSYRLRNQRSFLASAVLAATIILTMQIHASFILLLVSTAILFWRRRVLLSLWGSLVGLLVGSLTLIPTGLAFIGGELPQIAPTRWRYLPPVLQEIVNILKGTLYWFRLGSLDIGRRIWRVTDIAERSQDGSAFVQTLALSAWVLAAVAMASIAISVYASWVYFSRAAPEEKRDDDDWRWTRSYALSFLFSILIVSVIAPAPLQGWHLVITLHAACLPVALWLEASLLARRKWLRGIAPAFIVLQVFITVVIGLGNPQFTQPVDAQEVEQRLPSELRGLLRWPRGSTAERRP